MDVEQYAQVCPLAEGWGRSAKKVGVERFSFAPCCLAPCYRVPQVVGRIVDAC